jgi:hypothetical protein
VFSHADFVLLVLVSIYAALQTTSTGVLSVRICSIFSFVTVMQSDTEYQVLSSFVSSFQVYAHYLVQVP